jgi:hypothetical protein
MTKFSFPKKPRFSDERRKSIQRIVLGKLRLTWDDLSIGTYLRTITIPVKNIPTISEGTIEGKVWIALVEKDIVEIHFSEYQDFILARNAIGGETNTGNVIKLIGSSPKPSKDITVRLGKVIESAS